MTTPAPVSFSSINTKLTALVVGASSAASLANLALVIPQIGAASPSNTKGYQPINALDDNGNLNLGQETPPNLLFHYEGENTAVIESDITDHYVEDNTTVVDQIGLKPETVTVTGFMGELNNVLPIPLQALQTIANNLVALDAYAPKLATTAVLAYNEAVFAYEAAQSIAHSATSAWSSVAQAFGQNLGQELGTSGLFTVGAAKTQNLQQQMFQQFYGYWANRILFDVQTPWAIFTNMAIKSLRAIQDAETRMISSFEVTFKKIRVASTDFFAASNAQLQGKAATQAADVTNQGTTSGVPGSSLGDNIAATS